MKILLLRHAEAAPQYGNDFDRALTEKGKKQVREVAASLSSLSLSEFEVVVSPARRTLETLDLLRESLEFETKYRISASLYSGNVDNYFDVIRESTYESLLMIGHNPAISEAASRLSSSAMILDTAAWVLIEFDRKTDLGVVTQLSDQEGNY